MDADNQVKRKPLRLPHYDYAQPGAYFVTICTASKQCVFGHAREGQVQLNQIGLAVQSCWLAIPRHFPLVQLDAHVIMPNHLHGIVMISHDLVDRSRSADDQVRSAAPGGRPAGTLQGSIGAIVQNFKSVTTRRANAIDAHTGSLWQRNYHEHIIRNEQSLDEIRQYILANPWNWDRDDYHVP